MDALGDYLAIINRFIFNKPDRNLGILSKRALDFVKGYREHKELEQQGPSTHQPNSWSPPPESCVKLNFDGGQAGTSGWGWGFVIRNHMGNVLLAGLKHGHGFVGALVKEARSCLYGLKCAFNAGFKRIIVERDNLSLIRLLRSRSTQNNPLGLFITCI
ncbi:hypothetical protein Cgig2_013515 [Carnegiea gigantea]|uniref:RNase H type-1 domain-containing protein n=1 Tax=Carnegiea gigantea TaxID=171969 RepID=A0A9Q1GLK6_9CARY|nr:hypothetical protein Cgig2_013515 [Carnegiea gigantea]